MGGEGEGERDEDREERKEGWGVFFSSSLVAMGGGSGFVCPFPCSRSSLLFIEDVGEAPLTGTASSPTDDRNARRRVIDDYATAERGEGRGKEKAHADNEEIAT